MAPPAIGIPFTRDPLVFDGEVRDVSRGRPIPHTLSEEERAKVGLTRDTWRLEVLGDPENPTLMRNPLTREKGTEFNFEDLMRLAETKAVRFAKVMTCLNIGCIFL